MPIREITGVNDGGDLFPDNTNSSTNNTSSDATSVNVSAPHISRRTITDEEIETLSHFKYDEDLGQLIVDDTQGYYGLLSATYFDGSATSVDIPAEQVGVWQDVVMTAQAPVSGVHLGGVVDERVVSMTNANSVGHLGTGSVGDPIVFLLEGLQTSSSCTFKTSLTFEPDEDGGRLDSRILFERHSGATPSEDFPIDAAGLAMESGADEEYPHIVNVQFFINNTINTNGVGDAGKFRFQVKSNVAGTVLMNKMALFTQL